MQLNVLFICQYDPANASMVVEHVNSIYSNSRHRIYVLPNFVSGGGRLPDSLLLTDFDVIVFHYSVSVALESYVSPQARRAISLFNGLKVAFIQDEYRFVDRTVLAIKELGVKLLFTCVPESEFEKVYPLKLLPGLRRVNVLTGYNSGFLSLYPTVPIKDREIDIGYRGRIYPAWHGRSGREKWLIADAFLGSDVVKERKLKLDISYSESDRLYGRAWTDFIRSCKAMLGVESGCSVFDFDGSISAAVETYTTLMGVDLRNEGQYLEIKDKFFKDLEDSIPLNQISPRCLEAIGLRTLLILYEGTYSGVLEPWRHYVPLKKDFSNIKLVLDTLKNDEKVSEIISLAYGEVACSAEYSYRAFVDKFDLLLEEECGRWVDRGEVENFYDDNIFGYVANPHDTVNTQTALVAKVIRSIWLKMPVHLKQKIKNIVR